MYILPRQNKRFRRCATEGPSVNAKTGWTYRSRITAGLVLLIQLVMMHPYAAYGEPSRPIPPALPPETLPPKENLLGAVPVLTPDILRPVLLSGGTTPASGAGPDTAQPAPEAAENSGAAPQPEPAESRLFISAEAGGFLVLGDAEIEIPPGALAADTEIGIRRLPRPADTGEGLVNVTAGGGAYRFEPAGLVFNRAVTIRMGYDPRLRENEPALKHIYTYFYDTEERRWEKLERLNLDKDRCRIISLTTHFTDMINGTLTLPESPKPLQFDINSIKSLKAADPGAGVSGLEGLEANNGGTASFQFELNLPPGRNGMAPRVAVAYSSDGGNGVMGRGFNLQYGSRITIDTRWGLPQYDGRDAYMLDGVKLRETGRTESVIRYQPEREAGHDLIEHYCQGSHDYWIVTDKTGTRRTYGKRNEPGRESWTGDDAARKYIWELEEERDLYGNAILYSYEQDQHYLYIKQIRYTNYQETAGTDANGAYTVEFSYHTGRQDVQVDGRGKFLSERKWLLERITAKYHDDPVRTYLFTYKENYYGVPQLEYFGEEDPAKPGEYWWRYGFTYEEPKKDDGGQYSIFGPQETWDLDNGLQVQQGVSGGVSGSAATGVGIARFFPYIDKRITGGGHGGVSAGMNQSRQIMIDINGDGRPDSVRRVLQGLMVSLNLGDRFGSEHLYEIDMPGLDESSNMLASYGWNVFAGKGYPLFFGSLGYSYAETKQNGWTDTSTGFTDIDGDGVADIAVQGNQSYYRNTSHETGKISFEKMPLVKVTGERIEDVLEPLTDDARAGYNKAHFRQLPFRAWRPLFTGQIAVSQHIAAAGGPVSGDGIAARTYADNDDEADAEFLIAGGRPVWTAEETRRSYRLDAGEPVYFTGDPLWDTRGDDLVWNITVNYETIRRFEDMDKRIRYLPEKFFSRLPSERLEGPLRAIYTETPNSVPAQQGERLVSYTYTLKAQWETAVSPAEDLDEARRILIRQKRFVPGLILAEDFDLLPAAVSVIDEEAGAGTNYYEALCTYYVYDAGHRRYSVNQKNRSLADKTTWENLEETLRTLVENCDDDGINALAGYRWNKDAPVLTHYDPVRRQVYHQESDEASYERALDVPGYQNGQGHYLYLDEIEGSVLKLDFDTSMVQQNALSLESAVLTPGTGGALTVELPGEAYTLIYRLGSYEAAAKILYQEELDRIREAAEEAGEDWETASAQFALYYEAAPDGTYLLREGQENAAWVVSFNAAYKLGSWRSVERIIRYYADGEYPVQHNRLRRLTLGDAGYYYETVDLEEEGLTWNSGEDYSPENLVLSPFQYRIDVESPETGETEPVDKEMAVAECLYGGVRQWYYGVWTGDQAGKDFSGTAIEEQRDSGADLSNAETEHSIDRDIGKVETVLGNADQPLEAGMIESRDQGPVHLQVHENRSDSGGRKLVRDSGTGRTVAAEALIGDVSTRVQNKLNPYGEVDRVIETYAPYIEGNHIHPERLGGNAFYEIPGIVEADEAAGDGPGPMKMVTIRKSVNQGTDIVSGLNLSRLNEVLSLQEALANITATASGVSNDRKDIIQKAFALATFSRNSNTNNSYMTQSVQDINGDGIADIVQSLGNAILVTPGSREGFGTPYTIDGSGGRLSAYRTESRGSGGVPGSLGSQIRKMSSSGAPKGESINGVGLKDSLPVGGGITYADGTSVQQAGLEDINGDGLPDYIGGNAGGILSTGENFRPYESLVPGLINKSETTTIGGSFAISKGLGNTSIESTGSGYVVSGGANYSVSVNQTTETLLDINGDGLPDKIKKPYGSDDFTIYLNQGNRFMSEPVSAKAAGWDLRTQDYVMFQNVTDGNILTGAILIAPGVSEGINGILDIPVIGDALEELGTDDLLNSADDRGVAVNPFGYFINNYINSLNLDTTISIAVTANAQGVLMYTFVHPNIPFLFFNISVGAGGGTNLGADLSGISVRMMDINGDGLVDRVLRIPGSDRIYVRRNLLGEVGLLKHIDLPQGGSYDLQYAWMPGTASMPQGRYVLAELTSNDGNEKPGYRNLPYGEHAYTTRYTYGTGRYDRKVKEFYGFDQVTAVYADGSRKITSYYNRDYYSKGMVKSETIQDPAGIVLRFTGNEIDEAPYARIVSQNRLIYEAGSPDPVETGAAYQYDHYGNICFLEEYAEGTEEIRAEIRYREGDNPNYLHAHPLEIAVYGSESGLLRRRKGNYNWDTGALVSLTVYTDQNVSSTSEFTWDRYGNLERIEDSRGAWKAYAYDGELHQYAEQIRRGGSGAGPYVSQIQWNKKYGIHSAETDENGNVITYVPDTYGRISEIWSPYDHYGSGGRIPSVRYDYFTGEGTNWYSVTENKISFDYRDEKKMTTVMMLDGLGRSLYTAKQGEQRNGGGDSVEGWNISGAAAYDRKGRLTEEGQNQFVEGDLASLMAWTGGGLKNPVISAYDSLDRPVEKILPDGSAWSYDYGIAGGRSYTRIKDPLGNRNVQERDSRDNIVHVSHYDAAGTEPLTSASYRYNGMGELLEALDHAGNPLRVEYDLAGRRIAVESQDLGRKEYRYDEAGNLAAERDGVLQRQGKWISYTYDGLNRLTAIRYPKRSDTEEETETVYTYGPPGAAYNSAGRITGAGDESGDTAYRYGLLGETVWEGRRINTMDVSRNEGAKFKAMSYTGNYLGQMEQIMYPDGEQVNYEYDHGGQIRRVTGLRENAGFVYVDDIGYDEFGQRTFIRYGNGVSTRYSYDEKRRWLLGIQTEQDGTVYQNISYDFDNVGNIREYTNAAGRYTTRQRYAYDGLYQLTGVNGTSRQYLYSGGNEEAYTASYSQSYYFDSIGNMTRKTSRGTMTNNARMGSDLNYDMAYQYYKDYARRAEQIGDLYYQYDENGNLLVERFGGHAGAEQGRPVYYEDGIYSTDYGFALTAPENETVEREVYQRNYTWDYRNQLIRTKDNRYTVRYRYGADGRRALKYTEENRNETLYYNNMWQMSMTSADSRWLQSKHIFVGNSRIATKSNYEGERNLGLETNHQYWYHGDHIGSAQMITNSAGKQHERIEYAPYGETWIEHRYDEDTLSLPYRFTGKEMDEETGFYYYGARYLDPKTSRWLSADPALGEYIPAAPVNDETRRRNGNLPGMGGIYNYVNLHAYHYAGNNPVKYVDPDGRDLQLVVSKSRGTMEITRTGYKYHIQFFGPRIISRHSINVITSVNSNFPGANTIASDKGRIQLSGEGKYTNPTQLPSNTTYSITEPPRAVMYGNKDGKYGTGEQGLLINAVQTLPGVNANNDLLEDITYQDSGYMIHITPYGYTNGCVGIWYDPNDKTGASKRRAIEQMNWLVDQYKNATKNGEKTSITIMD